MPDITLVLLAAGMGSRYGGLKQLDPFGPSGETLMDYSLHDAARGGFNRVVFVIRRDFEAAFREKVLARVPGGLKVELAYQDINDLPPGFSAPEGRTKPWGTGHALRAARGVLSGPFAVINADDFYGLDGLSAMAGWLKTASPGRASIVTYRLGGTLSDHGSVARGVCRVEGGTLTRVTERKKIVKDGSGALAMDAPDGEKKLSADTPVSMNLWGFDATFMQRLEAGFIGFLKAEGNAEGSEFLLPGEVNRALEEKNLTVEVLQAGTTWFGVTYQEDKPLVKAALKNLVESGIYPSPLK
jgi:hypothetical protein